MLFVGALVVLWHQLSEVTWAGLVAAVVATPRRALLQALMFTTLSYLTLCFYDVVAMRYIRKRLPNGRHNRPSSQ